MTRRLFDGAWGAAGGFAGAARHLVWFVTYCIDGSATRPRAADEPALDQAARRRAS